jgi:hypothetical protein
MPTFDGGHYFLTALVPVRTDTMKDDLADTSPVHALRKYLAKLPTAAQTPAGGGRPCPFAHSRRTHFARLVIIDDVAYNGRDQRDALLARVLGDNPLVAQPQDHLSCPFLLFAVDFDAKSGADSERDSYLAELWDKMRKELCETFTFCRSFDQRVKDGSSFAKYIADCQVETTMSFNDYYADVPALPVWPADGYTWAAKASGLAFVVGVVATLILLVAELFTRSLEFWLPYAVALTGLGALALAVVVVAAYASVMAAGAKPFPAAPDSDLPTVLKSLHLQRAFTRFAIDSQVLASSSDDASAQNLYDDFKAFVAINKPDQLGDPTQPPGVIGI